jgi:hypothetical protein
MSSKHSLAAPSPLRGAVAACDTLVLRCHTPEVLRVPTAAGEQGVGGVDGDPPRWLWAPAPQVLPGIDRPCWQQLLQPIDPHANATGADHHRAGPPLRRRPPAGGRRRRRRGGGGGGGGGGGALDRRTSDGDGKMLWAAEARDSQSIEYRETSMATKSRLIQVGVGVKGLTPQR